MLLYNRLPCNIISDTLISVRVSKRRNKYAEVFVTYFGWAQTYPTKKKINAHEASNLIFQHTGVTDKLIVDELKEQVFGNFQKKCLEVGCRLKQTEPQSPCQNSAEVSIRELKHGAGRKMNKSGSSKRIWGHCLELEGLICLHMALDIYKLNRELLETVTT